MKTVDSRNAKKHMSQNIDAYQLTELVRYDILDQYTYIMYDLSDGDPNDDATVTTRRAALWRIGTAPADAEEYLRLGKEASRWGWEPSRDSEGCLQDTDVETTKVGDYAVSEFKDAYETVTRPRTRRRYDPEKREHVEETEETQGEQFFAAIERVAENPEDEEAWAIIKKWRDRQVQHELGWNG